MSSLWQDVGCHCTHVQVVDAVVTPVMLLSEMKTLAQSSCYCMHGATEEDGDWPRMFSPVQGEKLIVAEEEMEW